MVIVTRSGRAARMPPAERRAAIVAATLPLVLAHGAGVSTRQIAEAAGVAEGTIFRVFADKDELMCAVIAEAFDPQPTLRQLAEVDRTLPLRPRLVAATEILQQRLSGAFALIDALGLTGPPPRADERARPAGPGFMNDAFRDAVADLIGPDRARLRVPAEEFAHLLRLLVFAGTHPKISDGRPLSAADVVSTLLDGLVAGHGEAGGLVPLEDGSSTTSAGRATPPTPDRSPARMRVDLDPGAGCRIASSSSGCPVAAPASTPTPPTDTTD